jgi:rSAM/selenodomain-associated transferase 2
MTLPRESRACQEQRWNLRLREGWGELEQSLTIVVPALDAARTLGATLDACAEAAGAEVLVVDGGSRDATREVARRRGARVLESMPGRGRQLALGAGAARGDWLLFLHADTRPTPGWIAAARAFMAEGAERAAYFAFALDDPSPEARRLERQVAWRCRALALPYGDQGLLIARALYEAVGGFRPLPLMEDVDFVRRLGRRRLAALPVRAVTSAERWRREGWRLRSARNLACLSLWFLGVPPGAIKRLYG